MNKMRVCSSLRTLLLGLSLSVLTAVNASALEVIVDNTDTAHTTLVGAWPTGVAAGFYGTNYHHDNNVSKGSKTFTFRPDVPETATYQVYLWWTSATNRATNVPVDITHASGTATVTVNQQVTGGQWVLLGTYVFNAGNTGNVLIKNVGTNGFVVADAVRLVQVPPLNNLVSYWPLDETSGTVANDVMAHRNGTLTNGTQLSPFGKLRRGVRFDGVNDYIEFADSPSYHGQQLSWSFWFSTEVLDGQGRGLISKRTGVGSGVAFTTFLYTSNKLFVDIGTSRVDTLIKFLPADLNKWHHVAVVYDGSLATNRLKVYVDGGAPKYQGNPAATTIPDTTAPLFIGSMNANYTPVNFQGSMDDVRIYNRVLTQSEVAQLYNSAFEVTKLPLDPSMALIEGGAGDSGYLTDEQTLAGDPLNGTGGVPITKVLPPAQDPSAWHYPMNVIIDLGGTYQVSNIMLFDTNSAANVNVSYGTPFNWTALFTDTQTAYMVWKSHPVNVTARYLQVQLTSSGAIPPEIVVYGNAINTPAPKPVPVVHTPPTFDQFMGVTSYAKEPTHRQEAFSILREFHDWGWSEGHGHYDTYPGYPNNQNAFGPAWTGRNYDAYSADLEVAGLEWFPAVQLSVPWLGVAGLDDKPILAGSGRSPTDPASYIEHADHMFQQVARYGSTPVADNLLKLRSDQARLSGLNFVRYYEDWNEQNKWWKGRDAYFSAFEYAAMASADADGHLGTMGTTVGIRNADPNALFVMAGMARADVDYIKAIKLWSDYYRAGDFPCDVINVHFYSNDGGGQYNGTVGVSPEQAGQRARMTEIRQFRDQYLPGVEFWVTEFGYDTNAASPQRAPAIGTYSAEEVQGQWLIRSYLELAAAGVDRAFVFSLADGGGTGRYGSSGVIMGEWANYVPKISWWYMYSLKNRLKGLRFDAEQASGNPNVKVYRFKNGAGVVKAYAVWCSTSNETYVNNYQLALQGSPGNASVVNLASGDPDGVRTPLTISGGSVTVNVSERPIFVMVDYSDPDFVMSEKLVVDPAWVTQESGTGDAKMMFDEQALAGDPREPAGGGGPVTLWNAGNSPASAYIDLQQMRYIDRIYIRDLTNAGNLTIEVGSPGNWTTLDVDPLNFYYSWNRHVTATNTRYIRFTRANGAANFSEVVLYGK